MMAAGAQDIALWNEPGGDNVGGPGPATPRPGPGICWA